MARSRLSKAQERKALHKSIIYIIGIILIIVVVVKVAIPALINFSLFLATLKGDNTTSSLSKTSPNYIMSPIFASTFSATNSAKVNLNGTADPKDQVILYVNNSPVDTVDVKDDGTFAFKNVTLSAGNNTIKAKAKKDNKTSDFSESFTITYGNKAPDLSIDSPHDGDVFHQANVPFSGKTSQDAKVTINGFWAIVDGSGQYSYTLTLTPGDNQVKVISQDSAGNTTEKDITVKYNQ